MGVPKKKGRIPYSSLQHQKLNFCLITATSNATCPAGRRKLQLHEQQLLKGPEDLLHLRV